ncbi:MAG TPA: thiolase family protein [Nocardioidaceae bacterium]|nr:thiolase family protein [Nocardioidaceae bacterium]
MRTAVIVDVVRTGSAKGKPGGALSGIHPATLLAEVLQSLIERNGLNPAYVDDVIAGCVTQSGEQALNLARTAVLAAGFPVTVPATTIDRQCGSSQQAVHFAAQAVMAGVQDVVIACGVESMSRVPMFSNAQGADTSVGPLQHRFPEPLGTQGIAAELVASQWKLDREELDEFSAESHARATAAAETGGFDNEIVTVADHSHDETVRPGTTAEKLASLAPAFVDDGLITPGNSSPLSDGASAALIMSEERAASLGLRPRARFHSFSVVGSDPRTMLTGVIPATEKALVSGRLGIDDIDAFEVNEAFAPVPLAWRRWFAADPKRLNPRGGAIALGHPLGASGTRLLATLLNHLEQTGGRYGLQTMCEGGGMANATVIERL